MPIPNVRSPSRHLDPKTYPGFVRKDGLRNVFEVVHVDDAIEGRPSFHESQPLLLFRGHLLDDLHDGTRIYNAETRQDILVTRSRKCGVKRLTASLPEGWW